MKGKNQKRLGEISTLTNGRAFQQSEWSDEGLPIIRIQNLVDPAKPFNYYQGSLPDKFSVRPGDILLAWSGTPGTSFGCYRWSGPKGWLNQHIFNVRITGEILPDFLVYQVNSLLGELISRARGGVGLQHVTKRTVEELPLWLPPRADQERILRILDESAALRDLRSQADQRMASLIPELFHEMFGEGDSYPTRPLIDLVDVSRGISYGIVQRGDDFPGGVPVVRIADFVKNRFIPQGLVRVDPSISEQYRRTILTGGELVVSIRGTVGRVAIVPAEARGWNVAREVAVVPLLPHVSRPFVQSYMLSGIAQEYLTGGIRGIAQRGINLEHLRRLPVPIPPADDMAIFEKYLAEFHAVEKAQGYSRSGLNNLFQSLLRLVFQGVL
jgi:type I restriction enzyme S subunit